MPADFLMDLQSSLARTETAPVLVWLRRDLRLHDSAALHHALAHARRVGAPVALVFVFDEDILGPLRAQGVRADRRVAFIVDSLREIDATLRTAGSALRVARGRPVECIPALARELGARAVVANGDYEPQALARDAAVSAALAAQGVAWTCLDDHVMVPPPLLRTAQGRPYGVFTPYRNAWVRHMQALGASPLDARSCDGLASHLLPVAGAPAVPSPEALGFEALALPGGLEAGSRAGRARFEDFLGRIDAYALARDVPALGGTSGLSVHLRFGTVSVRELGREAWARARAGSAGAVSWLDELIWRDFYAQVLFHHPHVVERAFKPAYESVAWDDAPALFDAWRDGRTGYPLVDAAMRELAATGAMHNRLRMVVASFLCKDLGVDWRLGERLFAQRLNDFDLASNNGGWQWAASTGCDAQPWFRIFNPVTQSEKFDPQGRYIRRHVPELADLPDGALHAPWLAPAAVLARAGVRLGDNYPRPVVDHAAARARTLMRYAAARDAA